VIPFDLAGRRAPGPNGGRRRRWGAGLVLLGAVLLIGSLFVGWWTLQVSGFGITETLVLGFPVPNGGNGVSFECGGNLSQFVEKCPAPESYSNASLTHTGNLYSAIQYVVLGGIALGLVGGFLALRPSTLDRRRKLMMVLVSVALVVALVAPVSLTLVQPSAMNSDHPYGTIGGNGTSPTNTFWGTNTTDGIGYVWGASYGWFLALGAFVLTLVGLLLLRRTSKPPSSEPSRGYAALTEVERPESSQRFGLSNPTKYRPPPPIERIDSDETDSK
jgi:hypothetical protein